MRRLICAVMLVGLVGWVGCGDNNVQPPPDARPDRPDAADDDPDAGPAELAPCLDRPTDLPRPPTGQLSCDLLPPGFGT